MSRDVRQINAPGRFLETAALVFVLSVFVFASSGRGADTRTVNDITFKTRITVAGKKLALVGMGEHIMYLITVYVAGLYLEKPLKGAKAVIASDQAQCFLLHIDTHRFTRQKFQSLANDGFLCNCSAQELKKLKPRIKKFFGLFQKVNLRRGHRIMFVYLPGTGTAVYHQGRRLGVIRGPDFKRALFSLWLGKKPLDERLKLALLGR
ncbi:MAG: chalcone isomerase family protein [Proteobacteria bacterium]|nr:chalcone isomerase family protein [Pseudomonadota bacterium]